MFVLHQPSAAAIQRLLASQRDRPFSYREVGASLSGPPPGYVLDHNRIRLGVGPQVFDWAVQALRRWDMFKLGWVRLCWPDAPLDVGTTVAVLARLPGCWAVNACRVVYRVDEDGPVRRFGFAYGTLPHHIERGEERFLIEWHRGDNSVWYDLLAFSQPQHPLVRAGYPLARVFQKRFAAGSKRAMLRSVLRQEHARAAFQSQEQHG